MLNHKKIGANYLGDGKTEFCVFAPHNKEVFVHFTFPHEQQVLLTPMGRGYHQGLVENILPGSRYFFNLDGQEFPDPASNFQPDGVYGSSEVIDSNYHWSSQEKKWRGIPLSHYIIYELHVGTYTAEGTFNAIIPTLDELCKLGITVIEIMPIGQFCGERNWGYDGVFPFAPQNSYGTPDDLKKLIEACHKRGLAIVLDVIYNHLGPEGNVLANFGPYFTDRYHTPWGSAINFDGPYSDAVRYFFLQNALMWLRDYRIDALRLDALHNIFDYSAYNFLSELSDHVHRYAHRTDRHIFLIAESSLNDTKLIRPHQTGGHALDAQWNDDFHHALHAYLTDERMSYYQDFGQLSQLVKALSEGYVLTGQYSEYWKCRHGHSSQGISAEKFVVFSQNHDQIGNRPNGDRLCHLVELGQLKIAAALTILSPFIPLLFMGEEYAETAPFLYFTSHHDKNLINAVWEGRKAEIHENFHENSTPDPQDESSFNQSKLNKELAYQGHHAELFKFYQLLIQLRKTLPALVELNKRAMRVQSSPQKKLLFLHRWHQHSHAFIIFNFSKNQQNTVISLPAGKWKKHLDSSEPKFNSKVNLLPDDYTLLTYKQIQVKLESYSVILYSADNVGE